MLNKDMKNRLFNYISKALGMRPYTRGWYKGNCPSCGRQDKFGVNLGRNRSNCFVCGYHPSPINLVMELEGFKEFREVRAFLGAYKGAEYLEPLVERIETIDLRLPEGYTNILFGKSVLAKNARKYVRKRGFDTEEVSYRGWGYCKKGLYMGYIIIPFYMGGKLVYFNARRYLGSGPKYNNPKIDEFGIGKSLIIYNLDALSMYEEIFLVEGVINADTLGEQAIASGGKKISHYQVSSMLKSPAEKFSILLDPDAFEDSIKIGLQMSYHKQVRLITWEGEEDVNDIGRKETIKRVNKIPWQSYNDILKLKFDHEKRT